VSLRAQAAADLGAILGDAAGGFGWPITVTDPSGTARTLTGFSSDIGQVIDPQTGVAVAGRTASVALALAALTAAGLGMPRGIADPASKPWVVSFNDIGGTSHTFKVLEAMPDRALGVVVCTLESYKP
jgi:hypothetical protein